MIKYAFLFVCLMGCATTPPLYEKDQVSVKTAINLARTAYVKGCVKALNEKGFRGIMAQCRREADQHIRDITDIMEQ